MASFYRNLSNPMPKTLKVTASLFVMMLMGISLPVAMAQPTATTQPGLFFTIQNGCGSAVSGFAVGDELCLLQIGSATFTRAIFQGTLAAGEQKAGMACAGSDGNGKVIFVPPPGPQPRRSS